MSRGADTPPARMLTLTARTLRTALTLTTALPVSLRRRLSCQTKLTNSRGRGDGRGSWGVGEWRRFWSSGKGPASGDDSSPSASVIAGPGARPGTIPSEFEHAVGVERLELLGQLAGRSVFSSSTPLMHPRGADVKGTLTDPVLVESLAASDADEAAGRIVGCSGQPRGSHEIGYFWVRSARECTRCPECGQAFKLQLLLAEERGETL